LLWILVKRLLQNRHTMLPINDETPILIIHRVRNNVIGLQVKRANGAFERLLNLPFVLFAQEPIALPNRNANQVFGGHFAHDGAVRKDMEIRRGAWRRRFNYGEHYVGLHDVGLACLANFSGG
jgi:hypothetical protein